VRFIKVLQYVEARPVCRIKKGPRPRNNITPSSSHRPPVSRPQPACCVALLISLIRSKPQRGRNHSCMKLQPHIRQQYNLPAANRTSCSKPASARDARLSSCLCVTGRGLCGPRCLAADFELFAARNTRRRCGVLQAHVVIPA
jgi:hypothetical protein